MRNARIIATGAYAPDRVLTNQYFNELLGEDVDTWLRENVQIYERHWCKDDESTADLCLHAAQQALARSGLTPDQLDLIIIATDTPEFISPSTASVLQYELGAARAGIFDLNAACAGFVTGLITGTNFIKADERYQYVLVVGAYAMSKYLNLQDKKTVTLFADGAGAVILKSEKNTDKGLLASQLISQGQYNEWMGIYAGGTHQPVDEEALANHDHQLKMVKKFPPGLNPEMWSSMTKTLCDRLEITPDDVDHYFLTQINIRSIWETMDILGQPREKAHTAMHCFGYTGSACIPMAFNLAMEKEEIKDGDLVFYIGSGGGLAFAAAAFRI